MTDAIYEGSNELRRHLYEQAVFEERDIEFCTRHTHQPLDVDGVCMKCVAEECEEADL